MNTLGITGYEQIFLGLYLIAHGLIHGVFLFYFKDSKTNIFTGWSGKSLYSTFLSDNLNKITGRVVWFLVALLFTVSGLGTLDIIDFGEMLIPFIAITSLVGIVAYVLYFTGLEPTPYHWILGLLVDLVIISFIMFFSSNIEMLLVLLIVIWLYGMFVHIKLVNLFTKNVSIS